MNVPADNRIPSTTELATLNAPIGTKVWVESENYCYVAVPVDDAANNAITSSGSLTPVAWQPDGVVVQTWGGAKYAIKGMTVYSGFDITNGIMRAYFGEYAEGITLPTNAETVLYGSLISGLAASSRYHATLKTTVVIWQTADPTNVGSMDFNTDLYIATSPTSVATVTLKGTLARDLTRLPAGLSGATMTVAPSTGGFEIKATRPTGVACSCTAEWWCKRFTLLGAI
jgi:hypothetical protein